MFKSGEIIGVQIRPLKKHTDERGWLAELFREDEVAPSLLPVMSYLSLSRPGATRGPHEHADQTDYFCFIGPSNFKIILWDNRQKSASYRNKTKLIAGEDSPTVVIVPEGVVHAYQNIGEKDGIVINFPNRLYRGKGRKELVDEIRHEEDPRSPFVID